MTTVTAVFDGHCVICRTTRTIVNGLDWFNRVEFMDLHNHDAIEKRFPSLDHEKAMGEIHVFDTRGEVYAGFNGTRRMLRELPLGWPLWAVLHIPGVGNWLGPKLYRFIAKNRYSINRLFGVDLEEKDQDCVDGVCKIPQR